MARSDVKILYFDHEGGWGGASRSLWYLIKNLDREIFTPEVWLRQKDPMACRLQSANVSSKIVPNLPNMTPRAASHPANWIMNARRLAGMDKIAEEIIGTSADILHFNYEGLAPLAWSLHRLGDVRPRILHVRTMNPVGLVTKAFVKYIAPLFDHIIFITENEKAAFVGSGLDEGIATTVVYNCVSADLFDENYEYPPSPPIVISFFGTLDHVRGVDRLIELGALLKERAVPARINIFGRGPRYKKLLVFRRNNERDLTGLIENAGLADIVRLRGHSSTPELEMISSHVVIRTSRGNDPWGRDIIEAASLGRSVIATGSFDKFVVPGQTGFLLGEWDARKACDIIFKLSKEAGLAREMGANARVHAQKLFDPRSYARQITSIYNSVHSEGN